MKLLQFAVASIVDTNTGHGFTPGGGHLDYVATERQGRVIRARSVTALFASIRRQIGNLVNVYRERARQQQNLRALTRLNDHLLRDIGYDRNDLSAIERGQTTLEELGALRLGYRGNDVENVAVTRQVDQKHKAANEAYFVEAKCA